MVGVGVGLEARLRCFAQAFDCVECTRHAQYSQQSVFAPSSSQVLVIGKDPGAGKDVGQKEKRALEDEMARHHHQCNEYELGQTPRDGEGPGGLAC